ncbi:hypothetical protein GE061_016437 [Apolygus lucorum]|uniref:Uncharacterized protein n=1 Tax=Apolygus lucorum TaxID=248454 RepID=A0A8S9XI91_APOLU|nr:hypothetical protein GE061_016437 [Apolygus lucorum]
MGLHRILQCFVECNQLNERIEFGPIEVRMASEEDCVWARGQPCVWAKPKPPLKSIKSSKLFPSSFAERQLDSSRGPATILHTMRLTAECVLMLLVVGHSASQGQIDDQLRFTSEIINYKNENNGADGYEFSYETDEGATREERGGFVDGIWTVTGKASWWDTNFIRQTIEYVADDKGYKVLKLMISGVPTFDGNIDSLGGGGAYGGGGGYSGGGGGYSPGSDASLLGANLVTTKKKPGQFKKIMAKNER